MKRNIRLFKGFCCGLMAISCIFGALTLQKTSVEAEDTARMEKGVTFASATANLYDTANALSAWPLTYEAIIQLPQSQSARAGGIFANFMPGHPSTNMEIRTNGYPQLYYSDGTDAVNVAFSSVDVRSVEYVHLAMTFDVNTGKGCCYINGELKQEVTMSASDMQKVDFTASPTNSMRVGGDYRDGNAQYFKGAIKAVEAYSDIRTAQEIASDYTRMTSANKAPTGDNALCAYDLTASDAVYRKDLSGNSNHLALNGEAFEGADLDGTSFSAQERYLVYKPLESAPKTMEAEIYLPEAYSGRGGVVFGNYDGAADSMNLEIFSNGVPRFHYKGASGEFCDVKFTTADVRSSGGWTHLALVYDDVNGQLLCYVNGILKGTAAFEAYKDGIWNNTFVVGGDKRADNAQYFKGAIRSVQFFSDIRTAQEIALDASGADNTSDGQLLLLYNLSDGGKKDVTDLSGNGYHVEYEPSYESGWFTNKTAVTDFAYSIAVVGDTQVIAQNEPEKLHTIYDWILNNQQEKNIQFVVGVGDVTNFDTDEEWTAAKAAISKMDGKIPYSLVRGNHDSSAMINRYFYYDKYTQQFGGFYEEGKMDSSWKTLTIGETDYLFLALDYGATDAELAWASEVVESFPSHKVIISTHAYLYRDGTTLDQNEVCPPATNPGFGDEDTGRAGLMNNGDAIWDKFVSKHPNIFLVLCGHDPCDEVVTIQTEGVHGNVVTQMLIDPQSMDKSSRYGSTGMVAMLYFSEDGSVMELEYYSTIREEYWKSSNQYKTIMPTETGAHAFNKKITGDAFFHEAATCLLGESYYYSCVCGEKSNEVFFVDDGLGHSWTGDCDERACSRAGCGAQSPMTHSWDGGTVVKEATEEEEGEKCFACTNVGCHATKTEPIAKLAPTTSEDSSKESSLEAPDEESTVDSSKETESDSVADVAVPVVSCIGSVTGVMRTFALTVAAVFALWKRKNCKKA